MTFFEDIANSYYESGLHRLNKLRAVHESDRLKPIYDYLRANLEPGDIVDKEDLASYTAKFKSLQAIIGRLYETRPENAYDGLLPLLKECYSICGIDSSQRNIFTMPHVSPKGYQIAGNVLKNVAAPIVDIFIIPHLARFDLGSIAVVGHEVGHILIDSHKEKIDRVISRYFSTCQELNGDILSDKRRFPLKLKAFASHLREHLCDLIGAQLFGPAFDFAFLRLFLTEVTSERPSDTHPPMIYRMKLALERLTRYSSKISSLSNALDNLCRAMEELCKECNVYSQEKDDQICCDLATRIFNSLYMGSIPRLDLDEIWQKVLPELEGFRPPCETVNALYPVPITPREAVIVSTVYYYGKIYINNDFYKHSDLDEFTKKDMLKKVISEHINYSIEISEFVAISNDRVSANKDELNATLKHNTLWKLRSSDREKLIIVPTISPQDQYSRNAVDLRLGSSFLVSKLPLFTHVQPRNFYKNEEEQLAFEFGRYDPIYIPIGKEFILHPHQFVLASTLEYICLPMDKYAFVLGRSTWGRLGLNIATATTVQPGFRGCLTLELRNLGETPLPLTVGTRVAQIAVVSVPGDMESDGKGYFAAASKYIGPVRVGLPKIQNDPDWSILAAFTDRNFD